MCTLFIIALILTNKLLCYLYDLRCIIDLSGGQDGAVQLWEWGHSSAVCALRLPGTRAKVTSVSFNPQGNKLGVTDGDGFISLWQVGVARNDQNPFFVSICRL